MSSFFVNFSNVIKYNKKEALLMAYLSKKFLNEYYDKNRVLLEKVSVADKNITIDNNTHFDVFLSYSYSDKHFALIIYKAMTRIGYKVYIDIKDKDLDRNDVDEQTAKRIAKIMDHCSCLVYVHTASAKVSKWCPWELGYMSGKRNFRCGIIPLIEDKEDFPHQEYLGIYPVIDFAKDTESNYNFWANKYGTNKYSTLKQFINGINPYEH